MMTTLQNVSAYFHAHPLALLGCYYVISSGIGALPAPTATSGMFYNWFFKFANTLAANLARAYSTTLEKSPNYQDAVAKLQCPGGQPPDAA